MQPAYAARNAGTLPANGQQGIRMFHGETLHSRTLHGGQLMAGHSIA